MLKLIVQYIYHIYGYIREWMVINLISLCNPLLKIHNNKIVFDNFLGRGYGDNPKYIAEQLLTSRYDLVWVLKDTSIDLPKGIRKVKYKSIRAYLEYATAKVWVGNVRNSPKPHKRDSQIYLQTWHGSFSPKMIEKDAENRLSKDYVKKAKTDGSITDGIIVNCDLLEEQYKRTFWLRSNVEYLRIGLPRCDVLVNKCNDLGFKAELLKKNGLEATNIYVLYAPTFRDDYSTECYNIDYDRVINEFSNLLNRRVIMLVKFHPNVEKQSNMIRYNDKIVNVSYVRDIQELLIISDYLITDYSSCMFDFSLLHRPVFLFANDLQQYRELRGLLSEFDDFPFPLAVSNNELIDNIQRFKNEIYNSTVEQYFKVHPMYDHGNSAHLAAMWIREKIDAMSFN